MVSASRILLKNRFKSTLVQLTIHIVSACATAVSIGVDVVKVNGEKRVRDITGVGVVGRACCHGYSSPEAESEMEAQPSKACVDIPGVDEAITIGVPEVAVPLKSSTGVAVPALKVFRPSRFLQSKYDSFAGARVATERSGCLTSRA